MDKNKNFEQEEYDESGENGNASGGDIPEESGGGTDITLEQIIVKAQEVINAEKKKNEELTALCKRTQADFDNYRKRTLENNKKLREDIAAEVVECFIPMLDIVDNAIMHIKDANVASGIKMMQKQLIEIFGTYGVKEIDAAGQPFDPNYHNCVMKIEDKENSGMVIEVLQKGYIMNDKVIRYASVKVAD